MFKPRKFMPLLAASLLLAACGNPTPTPTSSSDIIPSSESTASSSDVPIVTKPTFEEPEITEVSGNVGDILIDINVNTNLLTGREYTGYVTPDTVDKSYTVKSSDESVFQVIKESDAAKNFTIKALKAGNAVLTATDFEGMICYRHVVRVRDPFTPDQLTSYMYTEEYWKGYAMLGQHYLLFTDKKTGNLFGRDDMESGINLDFTYKLKEGWEEEFATYGTYSYLFDSYDAHNSTSIVPQVMEIGASGDFIRFYYGTTMDDAHLLNILFPKTELWLHDIDD